MRASALVRNEWTKAWRSWPLRLGALGFTGLMALTAWARHRSAVARPERSSFALPDAWTRILSDPGPVPGFFVIAFLTLLVANEFHWRTARQNVIDGLSRGQFFAAKALLIPAVALLFLALLLAAGGAVALLGPDPERVEPLLRAEDLRLFARAALAYAGFAAAAFFVATQVRSPGAALGLALLHFTVVEQVLAPVIAVSLAQEGELLGAYVVRWMPGSVFQGLLPAGGLGSRRMLDALVANAGGSPPPGPGTLLLATCGWTLLFLLAAWALFRRRDL